MNEKHWWMIGGGGLILAAYALGRMQGIPVPEMQTTTLQPEISIVQFLEREGDQLRLSISGPVRLVWAKGEQVLEGDGEHAFALGQIPTETDRAFEDFAYLGNAKTMKFYPADSYPARGTEVQYRRFFQTREAALNAGFIASKLVK